jgi:hypothetical protein
MQQTQYIAAWKSGTAVHWRGLTWAEFNQFSQQLTFKRPMEVYIDLYRALLLEGPEVTDAPAGIVEYVAKTMLETNPFGGRYEDIAYALRTKRNSQSYLENAKALVAGIFRYTFEDIATWDADTFFDRVAKAEFLSGKQLEPADPNAKPEVSTNPGIPGQPPPRKRKELTPGQKISLERLEQRGK